MTAKLPDFSARFARTKDCGPYRLRPDQVDAALAAAQAAGMTVARIQLEGDWLAELGRQLHFPDYYGANFDALYDCLTDPLALPAQGCVLFFGGKLEAIQDEDDESPVDTLIAVLQAASDEWRDQGRGLWALFAIPGLPLDTLPA